MFNGVLIFEYFFNGYINEKLSRVRYHNKIKSSKSSDLLLLVTRTRIELVIPP